MSNHKILRAMFKTINSIVDTCRKDKDVRVVLVTGPAGSGKTAWCQILSGAIFCKTNGMGFDEQRRIIMFSDGDAFGYRKDEMWVPDIPVLSKALDSCLSNHALVVIGVVFSEWTDFKKLLESKGVKTLTVLLRTDVRALDERYAERLSSEREGNWMHEWFKLPKRVRRNKLRDFYRWHFRNWDYTLSLTPKLDNVPHVNSRSSWFCPTFDVNERNEVTDIKLRVCIQDRIKQREFYGAINGWLFDKFECGKRSLNSFKFSEGWRSDPKNKDVSIVLSRIKTYTRLLSENKSAERLVRSRHRVDSMKQES